MLDFVQDPILDQFSLDNRKQRSYRYSKFLLLARWICLFEYFFSFCQCKETMNYGKKDGS
jgi:hypothetical protein